MKKTNVEKKYSNFIDRCKKLKAIQTAIVHPCSKDALTGMIEAANTTLIHPIIVAPKNKVTALAKKYKLDISKFKIIDVRHSHEAAEKSVALAREGKVDALMKGSLHTDELMSEVVKKDKGLRTAKRISHAFVMATEKYHKPFIITDAAINIYPDLESKKDIAQNAIDLFLALQPDKIPKVAILSAIETVNPGIQSTVDAAALTVMSKRKQIVNGIVDGPLAFDNAFSLQAANTKGIESDVAGDPDIFLVPDLEAGNMLAKQLVLVSNAVSAGIILGATVPIILTSRADGVRSRVGSCAVALLLSEYNKNHKINK